ncbi:GNAT family N-acetyltransferase [Acinetobacter nectaris]|uniref:GNAT family N-acetyltransferase n=1 Tax=Acinetobacter nectaris TaxID=1219382 RepID=UPI001F169C89|nr:GNAT family protein [Acinetobacter nectaris]MCF9034645.1 GNAT family N-acetyltransferase [Acinetobacter nectaris]
MHKNQYDQPIGEPILNWDKRDRPQKKILDGKYCTLVPYKVNLHAKDLYSAYSEALDDRDWTWLPIGPFRNFEEYLSCANQFEISNDPIHYAVINKITQQAVGSIALMRIDTENGVVEMGFVLYSPQLKKTRIATEAQYLLMQYIFDELKYRRYEWKCDSFNDPSKKAALRLGFTYEGTFRKLVVYKNRSRDTSWFSLIDSEWSLNKSVLQSWLDPNNFDQDGQQILSIQQIRDQKKL